MKMHPETKHKMEDEDLEDYKDGIDEHVSEHGDTMPEHHKDLMQGMKDECEEYEDSDEGSEKSPSKLDEEMPKEDKKDDEPMSVMISFMNSKHKKNMEKK